MNDHDHDHANRSVTFALILAAAALFASLVAMGVGYAANGNRIDDIQESRRENLTATCELANRQNQAIIRFVLRASPESAPLVNQAFPLTASCQRYADRRLK